MRVGIISDTHGLLRIEALDALAGVQHIMHAGDVGDITILDKLASIAPVTAIRGNIDRFGPCARLPETETILLGGVLFHLLHSIHDLDLNPRAAGIGVVVSGHSHKASITTSEGVTYVNAGSAGPRRFQIPATIAYLDLNGTQSNATIVELQVC